MGSWPSYFTGLASIDLAPNFEGTSNLETAPILAISSPLFLEEEGSLS